MRWQRRATLPARAARPPGGWPKWGLREALLGLLAGLVLSVVVGVVVMGVAGWETSSDVPIWGLAVLQIPLWLGLAGSAVLATLYLGNGPVRDLGLSMRWTDVPLGLLLGAVAQFASVIVSWPVIKLFGQSYDDFEKPAREIADKAEASSWWGIVLLILVVVIGAPIVEELFYRGLVLRSVGRHLPPLPAIAVTAVVFGLSHFQALQLPALVMFGMLVGYLATLRGRLGPAIWAHVGFNATSVILLLWS